MSNLNVFVVGTSRNIGYLASVRLLDAGATVTFLLRYPSVFDNDETIQRYIHTGKAKLVKGDALVEDDCRRGWETASQNGPVDYLLFTLGGKPEFKLSKGFVVNPPNLVTQSFLNVIATRSNDVKVVTISSAGLTKSSHDSIPLALKPVYSLALPAAHRDKLGMERAVAHFAGRKWDPKDGEPSEEILERNWKSRPGLPSASSFNDIVVIRPTLLTDGECLADKNTGKPGYKASTKDFKSYNISRKDVAHFVAGVILENWSQWKGKIANVGY